MTVEDPTGQACEACEAAGVGDQHCAIPGAGLADCGCDRDAAIGAVWAGAAVGDVVPQHDWPTCGEDVHGFDCWAPLHHDGQHVACELTVVAVRP